MTRGPGPVAQAVVLPLVLLTAALLGGIRVDAGGQIVFLPPPLVTLLLGALMVALLWRAGVVGAHLRPVGSGDAAVDVSHGLTLLCLFAASTQTLQSVLPERGLLHWLLSFFLLWTLWTSLFLPFDAPRLLRSLTALLLTAFVVKHVVLAAVHAPAQSWTGRALSTVMEGATLGAFDAPAFHPATGYLSFFTLACYGIGLGLAAAPPEDGEPAA